MCNSNKELHTFIFNNGTESCIVAFEPTEGYKKVIFATNILEQSHDLTNKQKGVIAKKVKRSNPLGEMYTRLCENEIYLIYTVKLPDIFGFRHKERCYEELVCHGCDFLSFIARYIDSVIVQKGGRNE